MNIPVEKILHPIEQEKETTYDLPMLSLFLFFVSLCVL